MARMEMELFERWNFVMRTSVRAKAHATPVTRTLVRS